MVNSLLSDWKPAHGVEIRRAGDKLILKDTEALDWHLIRILDKSLTYRTVRLHVRFEPLPHCSTNFYVNAWGGVDLVTVKLDGSIIAGKAQEISVEITDNIFDLRLVYTSIHPSITIGMAADSGYYTGHGSDQFAIHSVAYESEPLRPLGKSENALRLIDVGAAGGLQEKWLPWLDQLDVTLIEPSPTEAIRLRNLFPGFRVIEAGLFDKGGAHELKMTAFAECSSILEPNMEELAKYRAAPLFEIVGRTQIACDRYDALYSNGIVPLPDVIKVDVQGAEYQVLQGFGDLLTECIGIEIECHLYEIYKGQMLLGGIVEYLAQFGLRLRHMEPQYSFDADLVEVNAIFTKSRAALSSDQAHKLDLIEKVWKLNVSDAVLPALSKLEALETNLDLGSQVGSC